MNLMAEEGSFRNKVRREREPEGCRELLGDILSPSGEFSPVPCCFFNDRPEKEKIKAQLEDFVQKGVCAFVLHPRIGIPEEIPYLSEAFFETVCFIVRTAANLNMKVVLYDEGMYPSGSAHGMVVAEKRAPLAADILNPLAVSCFIRLTHEKYYEKLGEYFGKTIIGFFTDEPDPDRKSVV